ncbi:MAG: hypothetical protein DRN49_04630, partial [Thaumarchaeota archaeon]
VKSIGGVLTGQFLAYVIDIERFPTVAKLWKWLGWAVVDGRAERRVKGQKASFNPRGKAITWKMGSQIVMQGTRTRSVYFRLYLKFFDEYLERARRVWVRVRGADAVKKVLGMIVSMGGEVLQEESGADVWRGLVRFTDSVKPLDNLQKFLNAIKRVKVGRVEVEPLLRNPTLAHVRAMALRKMIKILLEHIWHVWRVLKGLPVGAPYVIERLNHKDFIPPLVDDPKNPIWCEGKYCHNCPLSKVCNPMYVREMLARLEKKIEEVRRMRQLMKMQVGGGANE